MKEEIKDIQKTSEGGEKLEPKPTTARAKASSKPKDNEVPSSNDEDGLSLQEVIKEQVIEDERPLSRTLSLRKILGGDILNTAAIRRQIWLFILIAFFFVVYIIEIDRLQTELQDAKYKALSSKGQLTEKSRESNVLNLLKNNKDSVLKIASQPPYIITIPESK